MKVFVTRKIPGVSFERLLNSGFDVSVSPFDRPATEEEILEGVKDTDALLCLLTDRIDADLMDAAGQSLKIISNYAVGFDNIDVAGAGERGILVTNTSSGEVNEAVAEHTWALILALARRIVEADEATKRGAYKGWEPDIFLGISLIGKTLGIVGLGRIGSLVARRATGYKMNVLYNKRNPDPDAEKELGVKFSDLDSLLSSSDIVSLHVPLTQSTRGMINRSTLLKIKKGAYIVNTARGPIINESDLVEALKSGRLGAAALDVYENEPDINPELIGMENVVLTPHIASATVEAREEMTNQAVDSILKVLSGQKPENLVDEKMWEKRRI